MPSKGQGAEDLTSPVSDKNGSGTTTREFSSTRDSTASSGKVKFEKPPEPDRILLPGLPDCETCDNKVISARYTLASFLPMAIREQFRRFANQYFLAVGLIMALGTYTNLFKSAISPWTTLGPLSVVITFSLIVEGSADWKRHKNDMETNNAPCVVLRRADELASEQKDFEEHPYKKKLVAGGFAAMRDPNVMRGRDCVVNVDDSTNATVNIAYQRLARQDIRQGHFVLVKNREMVPADMLLLASSNDSGSAYIETSSIDGETNLKLRTCPRIPKHILKAWRGTKRAPSLENIDEGKPHSEYNESEDSSSSDGPPGAGAPSAKHEDAFETIAIATKRLTRLSYLGHPTSKSVYEHPDYATHLEGQHQEETARDPALLNDAPSNEQPENFGRRSIGNIMKKFQDLRSSSLRHQPQPGDESRYVMALTTEPPNPSVHTFTGKITLPPMHRSMLPPKQTKSHDGSFVDVSLDAENVLLRGAVLRNTEWAIGVAFFTGTDTKLVKNSFKTPSKFSQLDMLMNKVVMSILVIMLFMIAYLATMAQTENHKVFDQLFYVGFNPNPAEPWPYLPDLPPPNWITAQPNWMQYFCLYITLLNNFVPLSLYVTVEFITFCMLFFVYADLDMYDPTTNTRAVARSTIVTDLGRIQYIFSDKTGTLTQNVMRFKRCSVDGMAFGAPIAKSRPKDDSGGADEDDEDETARFFPLRQLLVGQFKKRSTGGLGGLGESSDLGTVSQTLTFNAEMFLRVLSLCHTVVVEKDIDDKGGCISSGASQASTSVKIPLFNRFRANTGDSLTGSNREHSGHPIFIENTPAAGGVSIEVDRGRSSTNDSIPQNDMKGEQPSSADGAPAGFAYQAESPDEGALVSAASKTYGFQVITRDSSGIRLRIKTPSHLQIPRVANGLKTETLSLKRLAVESAAEMDEDPPDVGQKHVDSAMLPEPREEVWTILAVNKFDSDRKRMSILLRAPPELGGFPVLFCKGADSAMLDPDVCTASNLLTPETPQRPGSLTQGDRDVSALTTVSEVDSGGDEDAIDADEWEMAQMWRLQAHLGDFAKEGLRTLVLGMRVLSEQECKDWLEEYNAASTSLKDRARLTFNAAMSIEKNLHIVGATAIEDKLQTNVPQTISTLSKAGIKLWVLTGDKRETAVEIGFSTAVLTPKMHLTQVPDNGKKHVRTQMAMEFIRLVKLGKLLEYQHAQLDASEKSSWYSLFSSFIDELKKYYRSFLRTRALSTAFFYDLIRWESRAMNNREWVYEDEKLEKRRIKESEARRLVREHADQLVRTWIETEGGKRIGHKVAAAAAAATADHPENIEELSLASEETPQVFNRASSAKSLLKNLKSSGKLSSSQLRELSLAQLTVKQSGDDESPVVDEDTLSMDSFFPDVKGAISDYDRRKRTVLERLFAVDREVRKGRLFKHVRKDMLKEGKTPDVPASGKTFVQAAGDGSRALVIEGAALKHLLGNDKLEAMLFSVAKSCDAVIACRVSPQQKALLLNLVRNNVKPEPITLAIGDGANDVGMIQEAHVGVGISGKEGKQAVNASDFAISQFRFLEDLILVHGRWNFYRLSIVVMFSFYKNAILAGTLVVYSGSVIYSGTPLFDEWLIAMFNFVAGIPIIILGLFDRFISKDYVKKNPEVYKATRENELFTKRILFRWIFYVFVHMFSLFFFTIPLQALGGGMTSAWKGMMDDNRHELAPGDGEGGDLKSAGTVTFSCLVLLMGYKVLLESKSIVHGVWPAFTCKKDVGEGFFSRVAYTWHGILFLSFGFWLFAINTYASIGLMGPGQFSQFTMVAYHVLATRSLSWMLQIFVPLMAIVFDLTGKVFSNMYFPTQAQIHLEIESKALGEKKKQRHIKSNTDGEMKEGLPSQIA